MTVIDVSEDDFQEEVLRRSADLPVVVDFWAEWCAPCRALGPVLERVAEGHEGAVVVAKLDGDANPNLVRFFGVYSIPAVKAFRDGEVIAEFIGARPPAEVEQFFAAILRPDVDELIAAGDEDSLRQALSLGPRRSVAGVALARILHARGESAEALELLGTFPGSFRAEGEAARIRLTDAGAPGLAEALAALDAGEPERALDLLLTLVGSAGDRQADVRRIITALLRDLGVDHSRAREWRKTLAQALS